MNMVDPSGMCLTGLDNDCNHCLFAGPGIATTACLANCHQNRLNTALEHVYEYLAQNYHGFRFDDTLPFGNTEQVPCGFDHPNTRGVADLVALSNKVAEVTGGNRLDYLHIMNSVLLRQEDAGGFATTFRQFVHPTWTTGFCIGWRGLDPDFNDRTPHQISLHIWVAVATTASPSRIGSTNLGIPGAIIHEFVEGGGTWEDFAATIVGMELGEKLRNGEITPSEFGGQFEAMFANPLSYSHPGAPTMQEMQIQYPIEEVRGKILEDVLDLLGKFLELSSIGR